MNEWGRRGWRGSGRGNIRRGEGGWGVVERRDVSGMEGEDRAGKGMSETCHHMSYPIMMGVHPITRTHSPLSSQTPPSETTCLYAQISFSIHSQPHPHHTFLQLHPCNTHMYIAPFACPASRPILTSDTFRQCVIHPIMVPCVRSGTHNLMHHSVRTCFTTGLTWHGPSM